MTALMLDAAIVWQAGCRNVARERGLDAETIILGHDRHPVLQEARGEAMLRAHEAGHSLPVIALAAGWHVTSVRRWVNRARDLRARDRRRAAA